MNRVQTVWTAMLLVGFALTACQTAREPCAYGLSPAIYDKCGGCNPVAASLDLGMIQTGLSKDAIGAGNLCATSAVAAAASDAAKPLGAMSLSFHGCIHSDQTLDADVKRKILDVFDKYAQSASPIQIDSWGRCFARETGGGSSHRAPDCSQPPDVDDDDSCWTTFRRSIAAQCVPTPSPSSAKSSPDLCAKRTQALFELELAHTNLVTARAECGAIALNAGTCQANHEATIRYEQIRDHMLSLQHQF